MRLAALTGDLMLYSRIEAAATQAGIPVRWLAAADELPPPGEVDLLLVDWAQRGEGWADRLVAWRASGGGGRLVLFGPHTDLAAHAEARAAGLGPMWARSRLFRDLPKLLSEGR